MLTFTGYINIVWRMSFGPMQWNGMNQSLWTLFNWMCCIENCLNEMAVENCFGNSRWVACTKFVVRLSLTFFLLLHNLVPFDHRQTYGIADDTVLWPINCKLKVG